MSAGCFSHGATTIDLKMPLVLRRVQEAFRPSRVDLFIRRQFLIFGRVAPFVALLLFVIFGFVLRPYETSSQSEITGALRFGLIAPYFILLILLGFCRRFRRLATPLIFIGVFVQGVATLIMLRYFEPGSIPFLFYLFGFLISFVGAFTVSGLPLIHATAVSLLLFGLLQGALYFHYDFRNLPYADYFRHVVNFFALAYLGMGFISAFLVQRALRQMFLARQDLRREKSRSSRTARALLSLPARLQSALLPVIPDLPGSEIAYYCAPAEDIGGDYVDIISIPGSHWLVIGDVSGKGLSAGLIMVMTHTSIHTALRMHPEASPARILENVNRILTENIASLNRDTMKYVTLSLLRLESDWRIAHSGLHQDIVIYRKKGNFLEFIPSIGTWLGLPEWQGTFGNGHTQLLPGDILFLYTDGLTEIFSGELGGDSSGRLFSLIRSHAHLPVAQLKDAIITEMDLKNAADDAAFILLRRTE